MKFLFITLLVLSLFVLFEVDCDAIEEDEGQDCSWMIWIFLTGIVPIKMIGDYYALLRWNTTTPGPLGTTRRFFLPTR